MSSVRALCQRHRAVGVGVEGLDGVLESVFIGRSKVISMVENRKRQERSSGELIKRISPYDKSSGKSYRTTG
ncbi:hypothetical protein TNCT_37141 [Trichonephila clavata]|uniref:Uncharacterized protein n=1 Tax=Trichonephila clavata TaxID=2740835 RepID=A0A8X6LC31_TRICU|nr:hypothetical protein TNCT_37141 [Trichonephila clavata]